MTTPTERSSELKVLLEQMRAHPSQPRADLGERAFILTRMLAREPGDARR